MIDNKGSWLKPWNRGGVRPWLLVIALSAAVLWQSASLSSVLAGAGLLLASMMLQFWSKGCLRQNTELTRTGPYRFVRHPFYLSNLMLDMGIAVMSGWPPLMLFAPLWWFAVYVPAIRAEEAHLRSLFGTGLDRYAFRVPMLLPLRRPLRRRRTGFDWKSRNIIATELPRAVRYLAYPLLFLLAMEMQERRLDWPWPPTPEQLWLGVAVAALVATGWVWKAHYKNNRTILPLAATRLENRVLYIAVIMMSGLVWDVLDPVTDPWLYRLPGFIALGISFGAMGWVARRPLLAEASLAVAMVILFELQWLAMLLVPFYLAVALDKQHRGSASVRHDPCVPLPAHSYGALLAVGLAALSITEVWI